MPPTPYPVTDIHIHIQPWDQLKPAVKEVMRRGKEARWERLLALMHDPRALLELMDASGIERVGLINYPSPDLMGFDDSTNEFAARYASAAPERLLPFGGVHPRFTRDPEGDVDRLVDLGIRCLKIHPPHQVFPANAYTEGLEALGRIYRRCEERGLPVMIHTGTSIFPGARSKYGNPLELDDVAIDFPDLRILMAHGGRPFWMEQAFFVLRRHPNVHLEVSGIPPAKLLDYFPRLAEISHKTVWGTDWPSPGVTDMRQNVEQFLALPLDAATQRRILSENSERLFPRRTPR
ncbi:MAG TPA: amidohydrolase family protein [Gemmatimonadales bacterium]|nr:amidohydrolase family protein [Gemmatimonadales bacterium]